MEIRNIPLRVLYTINSSPQYILARSHSLVSATVIPRTPESSNHDRTSNPNVQLQPHYATVTLKTCVDTICRSSPEIIQDFSRDFSVYVLDPLESNPVPALVNISNADSASQVSSAVPTEQPRGVAVGLGLMSWALLADESDSTAVTGTLIMLATGKEAVEVIFALRETTTMQKASLLAALRSWGLPSGPPPKNSGVHAFGSHFESGQAPKQMALPNTSKPALPLTKVGSNKWHGISPSTHSPLVHASSDLISASYGPSNSTNASTLATIESIRMRTQLRQPKPRKVPKPPPRVTESDKLMLAEDIYIGPVKKKGRPAKGSSATTDNEIDAGTSIITPFSSSPNPSDDLILLDEVEAEEAGLTDPMKLKAKAVKKRSGQDPIPISPPLGRGPLDPSATDPTKSCDPMTLLDVLAHISTSSTSNDPNVQNAALLAALNTIDTGHGTPGSHAEKSINPALINALRDLISVASKHVPSAHITEYSNGASSFHPNPNTTHSQDDEIIVLDKENINPGAFRRRTGKVIDGKNSSASVNGSILGSGQVSTPAPAPPPEEASSNQNVGSNPVLTLLPSNSTTLISAGMTRKRTLSDFLDEKDSRQGKSRECIWAERRDAHRHAHTSTRRNPSETPGNSMRHYSRLASHDGIERRNKSGTSSYYRTSMEPWTSPVKPVNRTTSSPNRNTSHTNSISRSPRGSGIPVSSPIRSSVRSQRKRFVLPEWARTQTSTQPRLSQEAQRALEESEERKREEKEGRKKAARRAEKEKVKQSTGAVNSGRPANQNDMLTWQDPCPTNRPSVTSKETHPPSPIAASDAHPVFAASLDAIHFPRPTTPKSEPPTLSSSTFTVPCTPPRNYSRTTSSFDTIDDPLFTPIPKPSGLNALSNSPLFSPHQPLISPLNNKMPLSPLQRRRTAGWGNGYDKKGDDGEDEEDIEEELNRELESAFDDLESSSSLPITSSEAQEPQSTLDSNSPLESQFEDNDEQNQVSEYTKKQHWVGLPPSSPPPPTSPILTPYGGDIDSDSHSDDELPVATSEAEDDGADLETPDTAISMLMPDLPSYSNEELGAYIRDNGLDLLFPAVDRPSPEDGAGAGADIFDQFTNLNARSDGSYGIDMAVDPNFDLFQNGLADFDFTEFWETFKPLVQDHTKDHHNHEPSRSMDVGEDVNTGALSVDQVGELDHAKLAEDVQALFSGCLM